MNTANAIGTTQPALDRPWYREFWVWFVIAIPLASVITGTSLVIIATNTTDSLVLDDFQKVALIARRETALEREAVRLNVGMVAAIDRATGQVIVRLTGESTPAALKLGLFHSTRRDMDRATVLSRDEAGLYRGSIGADIAGHWYVQIADTAGTWRITDRLADDEHMINIGTPE